MRLETVDPRSDPVWTDLVRLRGGSVFQSPGWLSALASTYGFPLAAKVVYDEDAPRAGMLYTEVDDVRGSRVVSIPFSDYCDPLVEDEAQWRVLADSLIELGRPIQLRVLHNDIPLGDQRFACVRSARWHFLDLSSERDDIWAGLRKGTRSDIRRAMREGVEVIQAASTEDLRAFFDLHLAIRKRKYSMLCQPFRFFEGVWREFIESDQGFLLLARSGERVIAGAFFLISGTTLYYKFNASMPDTLPLRPNDLLLWEAISRAKSRGLTGLDFGLTDWEQSGLAHFKRKFGANESTIRFLRHSPMEEEAGRRYVDELLASLTGLFTSPGVPDAVTEKAGDLLYRYFV